MIVALYKMTVVTFKPICVFFLSFRGSVMNLKVMPYFDLVFKLAKTMLEHYTGLVYEAADLFLENYFKTFNYL